MNENGMGNVPQKISVQDKAWQLARIFSRKKPSVHNKAVMILYLLHDGVNIDSQENSNVHLITVIMLLYNTCEVHGTNI
jgi:hypothetical protein